MNKTKPFTWREHRTLAILLDIAIVVFWVLYALSFDLMPTGFDKTRTVLATVLGLGSISLLIYTLAALEGASTEASDAR